MSQHKRILVTGGAGFLGSHICERIVDQGHDVICLDNLFTSQKHNIEHLLEKSNFEFIRHDITEHITLEVDQIYNMACPASPVHYQYNAIKTMKVSVMGAINMLGMAKRTGARILQASTSEIYGDPTAEFHPQPEHYRGNVNPIGVRACYDEGKRAAETLFFDYHRQHGVDIRLVRIFNTYGPRMQPDDGRVVTNLVHQARASEPMTIYGDGSQTRSFCYVDDLVSGMVALLDSAVTGPVNIGNPHEFTIAELVEVVREVTGSSSPVEYRPLPSDDPRQRQPDITRARTELGWEPHVALREGLARMIAALES